MRVVFAVAAVTLLIAGPAAAAPWDATFTIPVPRAGDVGLYEPHTVRFGDEEAELQGTRLAFELGEPQPFLDAYGIEQDAMRFRLHLIVQEWFDLPLTSWVHRRGAPPLATDFEYAMAMQLESAGGAGSRSTWSFESREVSYARRGHAPAGPECVFLTAVQGLPLREGDTLPLTDFCGFDLERLAREEGVEVTFRVAEITRRDGHPAARLRFSAVHESVAFHVDLWYRADIPYPIEVAVVADLPQAETAEASSTLPARLAAPLLLLAGAVEPEEAGEATVARAEQVSASIVLRRFGRGTGPELAAGELPVWPERRPDVAFAPVARWGPADGGDTFPYSLEQAAASAASDPTLLEFRAWLEQEPDARVVVAEYREQEARAGPPRSVWTFLVASPGGSAWRVTSEQRRVDPGLPLTVPVALVTNRAEREDEPPAASPEDLPAQAPTVKAALDLWRATAPEAAEGVAPNRYCWGCGERTRGDETLVVAGWQAGGESDWSDPFAFGRGENRSEVVLAASDGALASYTRAASSGSFDLLLARAPGNVHWTPVALLQTSGRPAGLSAPLVAGAAGATLAAVLLGLLLKVGAGVPLYTRLRRGDLLDQRTRRAVYDSVRTSPGIPLAEVARRAGCGASSARHHLRHLAREGLVRAVGGPARRRWFAVGEMPAPEMERAAALAVGKSRAVYDAILRAPGASLREVAAAAGMRPPATYEVVQRLAAAGLVTKEKRGRKVALVAVPEAAARAAGTV